MNQTFNIKRFARLAAYDLQTKYKTYLITLLAVFIGFFILNLLSDDLIFDGRWKAEEAIKNNDFRNWLDYQGAFVFCLMSFFVYVGLSFPAMSSKKQTMNYIMLPASAFEKYLLEILFRIIIAFGVFLLFFYVTANFATGIKEIVLNEKYADWVIKYQHKIDLQPFTYGVIYDNIYKWSDGTIDKVSVMGTYFFAAVLLFLFSIRLFFKRFAFIKTVVAVSTILFLLFHISGLLSAGIAGNKDIAYEFKTYYLYYDYLAIFACVTLLLLGYYKLKEKRL
jgi:hypothetical protein